jgi:hypothetical protein
MGAGSSSSSSSSEIIIDDEAPAPPGLGRPAPVVNEAAVGSKRQAATAWKTAPPKKHEVHVLGDDEHDDTIG